ncbi:unnamed protein product [Toxocara canis]|uniref:Cytochrome P450 n=1 Tax=Toxocara canis TaxID=6265 RepID=A0A183TYK3_TOXCA|nr:unnamed protein product [Toxocara canis]
MLNITAIVLLSIMAFVIWYVIWYYGNVRRYPPGPMPIPFFGNVLQLRRYNTHKQFEEIADKWGPVYTIFIPLPTVIITGLEEMREALLKKGSFTIKGFSMIL